MQAEYHRLNMEKMLSPVLRNARTVPVRDYGMTLRGPWTRHVLCLTLVRLN